jgi:hypothetical protein
MQRFAHFEICCSNPPVQLGQVRCLLIAARDEIEAFGIASAHRSQYSFDPKQFDPRAGAVCRPVNLVSGNYTLSVWGPGVIAETH